MQFHDWQTANNLAQKMGLPIDEVYVVMRAQALAIGDTVSEAWSKAEPVWVRARKPYYLVYPAIIPTLTRLNLDLDCRLVKMPMPTLLFRLPHNNPLAFEGGEPQTILAFTGSSKEVEGEDNLGILIDFGERMDELQVPVFTGRTFGLKHGKTVEESIKLIRNTGGMEMGLAIPEQTIMGCLRLVLTCCLLADDPSIIEPDVLKDDWEKYEKTRDQKYLDKARRRGKLGWVVGRQIELAPHYRRPHLRLAWTGPGRTVPKIVPRKGSIVHREVVERMPSGFDE